MQLLLALSVLSVAASLPGQVTSHKSNNKFTITRLGDQPVLRGDKECNLCVEFMFQFIDELADIVLNGGVIAGCSDLCGRIKGSKPEKAICDLLCGAAGIEAFIKAIENADIDPIWMCEDLNQCAHNNCTSNCASIVSTGVTPPSAREGATFVYSITFILHSNDIGTGEIQYLATRDGDKENYVYEEGALLLKGPPGTYQARLEIDTSNGPPNYFVGHYRSNVTVCAGMCGSKHQWSSVLASGPGAQWDITK